jgi:hypothetical protein
MEIEGVVLAYCRAWGPMNETVRRGIVAVVWEPTGVYVGPSVQLIGREALARHASALQSADPGSRIVLDSVVDRRHGMFRFAWRRLLPNGESRTGVDFGELSDDGRIQKIVGFFGPLVPVERSRS